MADIPFDLGRFAETIPGLLALLGGAVGYGKLGQRVAGLEARTVDLGHKIETLAEVREHLARIDERTITMDDRTKRIERALDHLNQRRPPAAPHG